MSEQQNINTYKFDNLQPITFLKKFNKMVDEDRKNPLPQYRNQLKVFSLSKFPLPKFYQKMQGIFETGTKKKDLIHHNVKSKDDIHDQIFLDKHRNFMSKTIEKMIQQSQEQQQKLQNYKTQYQPNKKIKLIQKKSLSQPKFKLNFHSKFKHTQQKSQQQNRKQSVSIATTFRNQAKINTQSNILNQQNQSQQQNNKTYLQKVQIDRLNSFRNKRKQTINMKDKNSLTQYLQQQKLSRTSRNKQKQPIQSQRQRTKQKQRMKLSYYQNSSIQQNKQRDYKQTFLQSILDLQRQQAVFKERYSSQIQNQIKRFDEKVRLSIQKTKKQKFW